MGLITTKDHIKAVIDAMDLTIIVDDVEVDGSNWKLLTTNTKWATYGKLLSGKTIVDFVLNESITVESLTEPSPGVYTLIAPFFYFGTFLEANKELMMKDSSNLKLPFIYLHMNAPENYFDDEQTVDFESDCAIYFMVDANPSDWLRADHLENAIKPMKQLRKSFISSLFNYSKTNASNRITFIENDYANFGNVKWDGIESKILSENISGTEILIKIPFNKCFDCCLN